MKKLYEKPVAEKIQFDYSAQVVAASGGNDWAVDPEVTGAMRNLVSQGCKAFMGVGCVSHGVL